MTRRRAFWIGCMATVAVLAAIAIGWGLSGRRESQRARTELEASYQMAFFSLIEHVENAELLLSKGLASASPPRQALILTRVWSEASAAQEALSRLPVGIDLQRTQQFLAQLGDFAYTVAEDLAAGEAPDPETWTTLARLKGQLAELMTELNGIRRQALAGRFRWTEAEGEAARRLSALDAVPAETPVPQESASGNPAHSLSELDRELQEVPTLIYDGPFSEQNLRRQPKTDLGDTVSLQQAARNAVAFWTQGSAEESGQRWEAIERGEANGPIPSYVFELRPSAQGNQRGNQRDQGTVTVEVSRAGGHVLWLLAYTPDSTGSLPIDTARARAQEFLRARGFTDFVPTGWVREGGRVTLSFVRAIQRGGTTVRIYPELVKVSVAPGGRITGFDARTFWLNRDPQRRLPAAPEMLPESEIMARVNPLLEVSTIRPAVIPLPSGKEALTYEVLASLAGDRFLLYYNALDGREETILRFVQTDDSQLTF